MIRESRIDHVLNELSAHFGPRVVARPPASAEQLAELEAVAGALPRDLTVFLTATNGLRIELPDVVPAPQLPGVHGMLAALDPARGPTLPPGFLPLGEDRSQPPCDWIVLQAGRLHGAVVRCDPWSGEDALAASCFDAWLDAWAHFLIQRYDRFGRPQRSAEPSRFDPAFIARFDADLERMQSDPDVRAWLGELRMSVEGGADFD